MLFRNHFFDIVQSDMPKTKKIVLQLFNGIFEKKS